MEETLKTTANGEEDDTMLPDGWGEGDDLFEPDSWAGGQKAEAEESGDEGSADGEEAPTTGEENADGEEQSDGAEETTEEPDGAQQGEKRSRKLTLKVNHAEEVVDIEEMSDEELIAHIQKSRAFDASREAENKRRFRQVYQEQIDAGMTEAAARMVAANEVGGTYALEDKQAGTGENAPAPARDAAADIAQLKALYPDFKEMPDEVAHAYAQGVPLLTAYLAYRSKQSAKAASSLKKENAVLRQNAAAAAKAPVKGVSGGGQAQTKVDPMLAAFDADEW